MGAPKTKLLKTPERMSFTSELRHDFVEEVGVGAELQQHVGYEGAAADATTGRGRDTEGARCHVVKMAKPAWDDEIAQRSVPLASSAIDFAPGNHGAELGGEGGADSGSEDDAGEERAHFAGEGDTATDRGDEGGHAKFLRSW